jgi:hypothetical protein
LLRNPIIAWCSAIRLQRPACPPAAKSELLARIS